MELFTDLMIIVASVTALLVAIGTLAIVLVNKVEDFYLR